LVVFTFDEADTSDQRGCCNNSRGGRIATWLIGAGVMVGGNSTTPYNHYSLLKSIEQTFGLSCLGHACDDLTFAFGPEIWGGVAAPIVASQPLPAQPRRIVQAVIFSGGLLALAAGAALLVPVRRWRRRKRATV
jgi:hypothetical protein